MSTKNEILGEKTDNNFNLKDYIINNKIQSICAIITVFYILFLFFISSKDNEYTNISIKNYERYLDNINFLKKETELGTLFNYIKIFRIYSITYVVVSIIFIKILAITISIKKTQSCINFLINFLINFYISFIIFGGTFCLILNIIGIIIFFKLIKNNNCSKELYNWLCVTLLLKIFLNNICTPIIIYFFINFKKNNNNNNSNGPIDDSKHDLESNTSF